MKCLLTLILAFLPLAHPIHVSITEINWNENTKSLEISHKIFIDDLEDALEKIFEKRLHLATPKENAEADQLIKNYLEKNFQLQSNSKVLEYKYLGKQYEGAAVWVFAEIQGVKKLKNVQIKNSILLDLHADQDNLLHFQHNRKHLKSIRTNRNTEKGEIVIP